MTDWMKDKSGQEGLRAEDRFKAWCEERGNSVYSSPESMNINDHIDFIIYNTDKNRYTVDIKGLKRIERDSEKQDEWTWIEFANVNGKRGWLYGKADYIVFERRNGWLFVKPKKLRDFAEKRVNRSVCADRPSAAKYKIYRRDGRQDEIALVELSELIKIGKFINDKE